MSRYYGMNVEISGHDASRAAEIKAAAEEEWPFDNWTDTERELRAYAEDHLTGGESEEEFTERLSVAIWRANGAFCEVVVNAVYLEELPYETHSLDQTDYARLISDKADSSSCGKGPDDENHADGEC